MDISILRRARREFTREVGLGEEAFTHLYQQHLGRVFNYVRYRLGPEEAEDITADIFARVWARRRDYDPGKGAETTWLWAIARNAVTDWLRRRRPMQVELPPDVAAAGDPLVEVDQAAEWQLVRMALEHLAAVDQEIIALRFGAGHTNRMIATLTGLTEANVAQRLRRALRTMRTELRGDDEL
jgi:RNA polymerase sigma-70 factor (ECF subfamily)